MKAFPTDTVVMESPPQPTSVKNIDRQNRRRRRRRCSRPTTVHQDIVVAPRLKSCTKSVTFKRIIRYKTVQHSESYTKEELQATWYSEEDFKKIFSECVSTVRKMVHLRPILEEEGFTLRGLEYKTPKGAKFRRANKARSTHKVMEEHKLQKSLGMEDPEYLAEVCSEASKNSRRLAHVVALRDEQEARPLLQSKSSLMILREKKERRYSSATSVINECNESYSSSEGSTVDPCEKMVNFAEDCKEVSRKNETHLTAETGHVGRRRPSYGVAAEKR